MSICYIHCICCILVYISYLHMHILIFCLHMFMFVVARLCGIRSLDRSFYHCCIATPISVEPLDIETFASANQSRRACLVKSSKEHGRFVIYLLFKIICVVFFIINAVCNYVWFTLFCKERRGGVFAESLRRLDNAEIMPRISGNEFGPHSE